MLSAKHNPVFQYRAIPIKAIITATILIAAMGISCRQEPPQYKPPLRIGLPVPYFLDRPAPDEEPLAFEFLTDLVLGTWSEDFGLDWQTKKQPLYFTHRQRVFSAFSIAQERDGGKTFFAELKPNLFFHDGSIATVDDVEFSLKRFPERFPATQRIKLRKLSTRSFTLSSDRQEHWMHILGVPLKKQSVAVDGKSISAGPYIIASVDRKKRKVRLKAFDKYVNGPPPAPEVEYTLNNNSEIMMFGFLADETDFICGLNRGQQKTIGDIPGKQVVQYVSNYIYMMAFNSSKPPTNDILVRKAISLLIDRQTLVSKSNSLQGVAIPTQYQFAMSEPVTMPHAADPPNQDEAFKLLRQAGYKRTSIGWEKDGKQISLSMRIPSHLTAYIPEVRIITRWLNDAGLKTSSEITSIENTFNRNETDNFHVLFSAFYDSIEMESNHMQFEVGDIPNLFQTTDPYPAVLLEGAKSSSLTTSAKEIIIQKIADLSYTAPLFYQIDICAGKRNSVYENAFFRSPGLYSIINGNAPSGSLRSQTGLK